MNPKRNSLKPGELSPMITLMKTETILVTQRERFATDSSRRARALEKFRKLNEATIQALRRAGEEREQKELAHKLAVTPR